MLPHLHAFLASKGTHPFQPDPAIQSTVDSMLKKRTFEQEPSSTVSSVFCVPPLPVTGTVQTVPIISSLTHIFFKFSIHAFGNVGFQI